VIELQVKIRGKKRAGIKLMLEKQQGRVDEKKASEQINNLVLKIKESDMKQEKL